MRNQQVLLAGPIEGYKIVNEDMTCRDFKFELGIKNVLPNPNALELCRNGFHFCKYPSGPWAHYSQGRLFKVRAYGVLDVPIVPGADYKMVCEALEFYEEINVTGNGNTGNMNTGNMNTGNGNTGNRNTGNMNTGNRNTGNMNTGNMNTGNMNTGYMNTGDMNTGNSNTGYMNTGNWNTGDRNTGNWNTGDWNTGDGNTGDGNCSSNHSGSLNCKVAPIYLFDKITKVKREDIPWSLVNRLGGLLSEDKPINPDEFLSIPNATPKDIELLHKAHILARKAKGN